MSRPHPLSSRHAGLALLVAALVVPLIPGAVAAPETADTWQALAPRVTGPAPGPVPDAPRQAADTLTFNLTGVTSDFAPESYKGDDRFNTRNPSDLENQTTNWDNALGHRISFFVEVSSADADALDCDDRFTAEAFVDTLGGRLYGWTDGMFDTNVPEGADDVCPTGLPGVRSYNVTFDLDGTPPAIQPDTAYPALGTGVYVATLRLYHHDDPSPANPTGDGPLAGLFDIPFQIVSPDLSLDDPFQRFPEKALRLFSDAGATPGFPDQFRMTTQPLAPGDNTTLSITFPGAPIGARFERVDHVATRTGVGVETPTDPPQTIPPLSSVNDKLQNADDRASVEIRRIVPNLSNDTVPASRQVLMQVRGADFATAESPTGVAYVPLHVVAIHLPATMETAMPVTGAASYVAAVSDQTFPVRGFTIEGGVGGLTGTTSVILQDTRERSGGPTGSNAGDIFALADRGVGHEVITRSQLTRDSNGEWVRGSIRHADFEDTTSSYTILGMLYGPSDEFLGMTTMRRGVDIQAGALRTVEGSTESIPLTITNLATDFDDTPGEADFAITVRITSDTSFPDGSAYNTTVRDIPEGGSVTLDVPLAAAKPGDFNIVFTARSGEISDKTDTTVQVITKERAREEGRKWYQIPSPSALLVVATVAALAGVLRRRS